MDRIHLPFGEIVVSHKPAEIIGVVPPLQLITINAQKLTGKIAGVSMAIGASVVPQPV